MRCTVPQISWHSRDPIYTVDIQPKKDESEKFYRVATGGADSHVVIWHLKLPDAEDNDAALVEFAAVLDRHVKSVNVVRFSKDGELLASAGDDATIIIWKLNKEATFSVSQIKEQKEKELWITWKVLKGHLEDIYDLSWSNDGSRIISGSVDNSAIIWDIHKGKNLGLVGEHKGFVQGVAWDPKDKYLATMCTDRTLRILNIKTKRTVLKIEKTKCSKSSKSEQCSDDKSSKLFHDDALKTFFRRLCFSPNGEILIAPSGVMPDPNDKEKRIDVSYVFTRRSLNQPALYLPSPCQYTFAARCCPMLFQLRESPSKLFALPYRIIYAIATKNAIVLYDTQQTQPFASVYNIHYTGLTDISWSSDGRVLLVSSTDGYCSIIVFEENELGVPYEVRSDEVIENVGHGNDNSSGMTGGKGRNNKKLKNIKKQKRLLSRYKQKSFPKKC